MEHKILRAVIMTESGGQSSSDANHCSQRERTSDMPRSALRARENRGKSAGFSSASNVEPGCGCAIGGDLLPAFS